MVVASIYSVEDQSQASTPFFYRDLIRTFVCSMAPLVQDYYVFISPGVNPDQLFPERPSNVHVAEMSKLFECVSHQPIDIWHDFGYGNHRTLEHLRRLTGQDFRITCDFRIERLLQYADSGRPDWDSYDGVVYSTEHARSLHMDPVPTSGTRTHAIIAPGMDFNFINPLSRDDARRLLGIPQDEVIFLCVSDFSPRHGTDLLPVVRAFELAASAQDKIRLIISGRDIYGTSPALKNGLLDKTHSSPITLLANPDQQALAMLFAAADVYVHLPDSTLKDSPLTLLYAIGHKLPIIAARWPSAEALLDHLESALLLPMYSQAAVFGYLHEALCRESNELCSLIVSQATAFDLHILAEQLRLLAEDANHRETLGKAAFNRALLHHQPNQSAHRYFEFWKGLERRSINTEKVAEFKKLRCFQSERDLSESVTQLAENCPLGLTELGEAVLSGSPFQVYDDTTNLVFTPVIMEVLKISKNGIAMNELVAALTTVGDETSRSALRSGMLYHILLSLKRGFLRRK